MVRISGCRFTSEREKRSGGNVLNLPSRKENTSRGSVLFSTLKVENCGSTSLGDAVRVELRGKVVLLGFGGGSMVQVIAVVEVHPTIREDWAGTFPQRVFWECGLRPLPRDADYIHVERHRCSQGSSWGVILPKGTSGSHRCIHF